MRLTCTDCDTKVGSYIHTEWDEEGHGVKPVTPFLGPNPIPCILTTPFAFGRVGFRRLWTHAETSDNRWMSWEDVRDHLWDYYPLYGAAFIALGIFVGIPLALAFL